MLYFQTVIFVYVNYSLPHIRLLFKRLLLAYLLFFICRSLFYIFNYTQFSQFGFTDIAAAFLYGTWFDTSTIVYAYGVMILMHAIPLNARSRDTYQTSIQIYFIAATFLCVLLNLIDVGYFPFSGKRSGMELIRMQSGTNAGISAYLADYWHLVLILIVMMWMSWRYFPKLKIKVVSTGWKQLAYESLILVLLAGLSFVGARGGFRLKPLNTFDAAKLTHAELVPVTLNTPFQMLMTLEQVGVKPAVYMTDTQARSYFNPEAVVERSDTAAPKNIVLIIVESMGKEYVGYYNKGKGYTPFIDSLMQQSIVYQHAYANGKRSIEGIPALLAAMPSWMESDYINSYYQTNKLHSTGYYLQQQGYDASFYHGGKNGTMNFDNFVANTQAGRYYGLNEYPDKKDFDGNWGIYDEPYLQYVSAELSKKQQPFFATVFTLSSHHPYKIPDNRKGMFKGGPLPIHASMEYADFALKQFFETARKQSWFSNTVFIITADHSSENTQPYYQTSQGKYEVPLLIYNAAAPVHKTVDATVDHLSIMPMILYKTLKNGSRFFSLGNAGYPYHAIQYADGIYQMISYPHVLKFDGTQTRGYYDLSNDSLMKRNMVRDTGSFKPADKETFLLMENTLKSVIQQYNDRLIHNRTH